MGTPRFYVACPLGDRTAGPEALALLVASMRARGVEAYLIPMRNFRGRRPHPEYDVFDYALADAMPNDDDAHLVLTEVSPIESRRELDRTPDSRVWMLWLSVNNSPIPRARYYKAGPQCCAFLPPGGDPSTLPTDLWPYDHEPLDGPLATWREAARRKGGWSIAGSRAIAVEAVSIAYAERIARRRINLGTQSYYGQGFCRTQLGNEAFLLTDYPRAVEVTATARNPNLVLYNGAKGQWKVPELRALLPDVDFRPIEGMTYPQVCEALASAALYVEIGHLPGRDRLPREAARFGTPTIMLARGAGYCWQDFPIGERYRIPYTVDWAARMAPIIAEALADPVSITSAQEPFRAWVEGEPQRYDAALDAWIERATST